MQKPEESYFLERKEAALRPKLIRHCQFLSRDSSFSNATEGKKLTKEQGCQMVGFQNKNPNLGQSWRVLARLENVYIFYGHLEYFFIWRFGIFYDPLVHFVFIWYIFSGFGIMYQEKSGNPAKESFLFPHGR
jgi:hypothetical protein